MLATGVVEIYAVGYLVGLRELCSKNSSLFYSEFSSKSLHYVCDYFLCSSWLSLFIHFVPCNDNKIYKLLAI